MIFLRICQGFSGRSLGCFYNLSEGSLDILRALSSNSKTKLQIFSKLSQGYLRKSVNSFPKFYLLTREVSVRSPDLIWISFLDFLLSIFRVFSWKSLTSFRGIIGNTSGFRRVASGQYPGTLRTFFVISLGGLQHSLSILPFGSVKHLKEYPKGFQVFPKASLSKKVAGLWFKGSTNFFGQSLEIPENFLSEFFQFSQDFQEYSLKDPGF